ncbi:MAG: S1 family peptidase [Planctomycetota bacterium]|nr:S1 family peptidase [Planctomycetota bacterium]
MWNATDGIRLEVRGASSDYAASAYNYTIRQLGLAPRLVRAAIGTSAQAQRSLASGDRIGHPRCACFGTLGAFLVAQGRQTLALSNSHVLGLAGHAKKGDPVHNGYGQRIGTLLKTTRLQTRALQRADAAIALLDHAVQPAFAGLFSTQSARLGDQVYKQGATTGRTYGVVTSTAYTLSVSISGEPVWFEDQLVIQTNPLDRFSREGDSGSVVRHTTENSALGLLFAGDQHPVDLAYRSYANPIHAVFQELAR